jgi:FdhE protein
MTAPVAALQDLKRQRPEWQAWLGVVEEALRETGTPAWDAAVPEDVPGRSSSAPLLAGATLAVPMRSVRHLWQRLIRIAAHSGMPKMAGVQVALHVDVDRLVIAALCQDADRITDIASRAGADADALQALAALLPMPVLHACNRRWTANRAPGWVEGYCPICGAWPAFAEVLGIERNRHFRCGRCSAAWHAHALWCPYCGTRAHDDLVSLVPEKNGVKTGPNGASNGAIEACKGCKGYVKTFTRLRGCAPGTVMLEDLASVEFDVAALDHGYRRPAGAGCVFSVSVTDSGAARGLFSW